LIDIGRDFVFSPTFDTYYQKKAKIVNKYLEGVRLQLFGIYLFDVCLVQALAPNKT